MYSAQCCGGGGGVMLRMSLPSLRKNSWIDAVRAGGAKLGLISGTRSSGGKTMSGRKNNVARTTYHWARNAIQ